MKKLLLFLAATFISTLFIFTSCETSKIQEIAEENEDFITASVNSENSENSETNLDNNSDSTEQEEQQSDNSEIEISTDDQTSKNTLEELDEPLVIDYFPGEEDDDEVTLILEEVNYTEENDDPVEEPVLEVESPTELDIQSLNSISTSFSDNSENSSQNNSENKQIPDLTNQKSENVEPLIEIKSDIQETTSDISSDNNTDEIFEEIIVPTRKITVSKGEFLDITYPGLDWKYYGITDNSTDLEFVSQKQSSTNTKFILEAKKPGKKLLHFYKIDFLTGNYIDDYIEVEVTIPEEKKKEPINSESHIQAPKYKAITNTKKTVKKESEEQKFENDIDLSVQNKTTVESDFENKKSVQSASKEEVPSVQNESPKSGAPVMNTETQQISNTQSPSELLAEAEKLFNEKKYTESLEKIKLFLEISQNDRDKALFLQGNIFETQSNVRNIKQALNSYNMLISNYPGSRYWDDANKRIIYLKRFYMEGR